MTSPSPTRQFYQVNTSVICEQCNPPWAMLIRTDSAISRVVILRLSPDQLQDMTAEDIVSKCDICGTPFFTQ